MLIKIAKRSAVPTSSISSFFIFNLHCLLDVFAVVMRTCVARLSVCFLVTVYSLLRCEKFLWTPQFCGLSYYVVVGPCSLVIWALLMLNSLVEHKPWNYVITFTCIYLWLLIIDDGLSVVFRRKAKRSINFEVGMRWEVLSQFLLLDDLPRLVPSFGAWFVPCSVLPSPVHFLHTVVSIVWSCPQSKFETFIGPFFLCSFDWVWVLVSSHSHALFFC